MDLWKTILLYNPVGFQLPCYSSPVYSFWIVPGASRQGETGRKPLDGHGQVPGTRWGLVKSSLRADGGKSEGVCCARTRVVSWSPNWIEAYHER